GDVITPTQTAKVMKMPKWIGSIPASIAIGRKIGVKISTAGVASMNVPTISSTMAIISRMTAGLSEMPSIASEMMRGTWAKDMTQDIAVETPIRNATIAVVFVDSMKMPGSIFQEIVR